MTLFLFIALSCLPTQKKHRTNTDTATKQRPVKRPQFGYNPSEPSTCTIEIKLPNQTKISLQTWGINEKGALLQGASLARLFWTSWQRDKFLNLLTTQDETVKETWKFNQYISETSIELSSPLECQQSHFKQHQGLWESAWKNGPPAIFYTAGLSIELARRKSCVNTYAVSMADLIRESQKTPHGARTLGINQQKAWEQMVNCHLSAVPIPKPIEESWVEPNGPFQCQSIAVVGSEQRGLGLTWGDSAPQAAILSLTATSWQGLLSNGFTAPEKKESGKQIMHWGITALSGMTTNESFCGKIQAIPLKGEWISKRKSALAHCEPTERNWTALNAKASSNEELTRFCKRENAVFKSNALEKTKRISKKELEETALQMLHLQTDGCLADCLNNSVQTVTKPIFLPRQFKRKSKSATIALFWSAVEAENKNALSLLLPNNGLFPLQPNIHRATIRSLLSPQFKQLAQSEEKQNFEAQNMDSITINGHHLLKFNTIAEQ